jgi:hypothetical protein
MNAAAQQFKQDAERLARSASSPLIQTALKKYGGRARAKKSRHRLAVRAPDRGGNRGRDQSSRQVSR